MRLLSTVFHGPLSFLRRVATLFALLSGLAGPALAQPTLVAERQQPRRYFSDSYALQSELYSFALPGRRYVHCGTSDNRATIEVMLAVTKANGDTVRYLRPVRPLSGSNDYLLHATLNPDYSLTYFRLHAHNSAAGSDSLSLVNLDTMGQVRWRRSEVLSVPYAQHMLRTGDGYLLATNAFVLPGASNDLKPAIQKTDGRGNPVWQRSWGTRGYGGIGLITDLLAHPDGSYMALGYTDNGAPYTPGQTTRGRADYYLAKLRPNGDTIWTRRFGSPTQDEYGQRLRLCPDGGYAVLGFRYATATSTNKDGQVLKVDSVGRVQWTSTTSWPTSDFLYRLLQPLTNGNVVFGGYEAAATTVYPFFQVWGLLLCNSAAGTQQWRYRHTYPANQLNWYTMVNHADGSAYLTGAIGNGTSASTYRATAYFGSFANVGVPYEPDLCRTPPVASFAPALSAAGDSLLAFSLAQPGPRYAELVAWHWDFGDGTSYDGATPPWHRYATRPAAGTAVQLTVTNNLGCTSTHTEYPWGRPTATQQAKALAAGASVFPNPAVGGQATLLVPGWAGRAAVGVQVFNSLGQRVRTYVAQPQGGELRQALELAGLPAGVYVVQVLGTEGPLVKRLVVN